MNPIGNVSGKSSSKDLRQPENQQSAIADLRPSSSRQPRGSAGAHQMPQAKKSKISDLRSKTPSSDGVNKSIPSTSKAWASLADSDNNKAWDRVEEELRFRPSIDPKDWPVFAEPHGSVTWSFAAVWSSEKAAKQYCSAVHQALLAGSPASEPYIMLDWHHSGSYLWPSRLDAPAYSIPNGDYILFLSLDHSAGFLGNPWEQTVCVYGAKLVEAFSEAANALLGPPIRRNPDRRKGGADQGSAAQNLPGASVRDNSEPATSAPRLPASGSGPRRTDT